MSRRVKAIAALVFIALAGVLYVNVSGLSLDERRDIGAAEDVIERNASASSERELRVAVDRLIVICRSDPDALYDTRSMRDVLREASEDLGQRWPDLANRLLHEADRGLGPIDVGTP